MLGKASAQTSSPVAALGKRHAGVVEDLDRHAERRALDLAAYTGRFGLPPTKAPHRSVPPLIEARCTSGWTASYTHAKPSRRQR